MSKCHIVGNHMSLLKCVLVKVSGPYDPLVSNFGAFDCWLPRIPRIPSQDMVLFCGIQTLDVIGILSELGLFKRFLSSITNKYAINSSDFFMIPKFLNCPFVCMSVSVVVQFNHVRPISFIKGYII